MKSRKPSIPYIIWMAVFTMIPMIMVGITAFTGKNGGFSFEAFEKAFFYKEVFLRFAYCLSACLYAYKNETVNAEFCKYAFDDSYVDELFA